jgi:hypothetical protein
MASRLIEKPWGICGDETLGVEMVDDPDSPCYGRIPITPVMDTQLDQIVIQDVLTPLKKVVLRDLQRKILNKDNRIWIEVFIVIFILLNSIEIATAHDHEFATDYKHHVRLTLFQ